jgi:hypothetical protein
VTCAGGRRVGIEVTEAIEPAAAAAKYMEDTLARHVAPVLRSHSPPYGLVDYWGGSPLPPNRKDLRVAVGKALDAAISKAGSLSAFLQGLPQSVWTFHWASVSKRRPVDFRLDH